MKRFEALETFRFIAALIIALGHFFFVRGITNIIPGSYVLGVEFFFCLSAFVITLTQKFDSSTDEYLKKFLSGRLIRLLLPYMVIMIIYNSFFYKLFNGISIGLYNWFVSLFLLHIMGLNVMKVDLDTYTVSWALGLELYVGTLFFVFIYFLRKKINGVAVAFFCFMGFVICISIFKHNSPYFLAQHFTEYKQIPFGFFRILVSYFIGTIVAIFYRYIVTVNLDNNKFFKYKNILFTILEILILYTIVRFYGKINYNMQNQYIFPVIVGIMIFIFSFELGVISKIFKKFSSLGKLSFSFYLLHPFVFQLLKYFNMAKNNYLYIYLLGTFILTFVFYNLVEKQFIKMKYKLREMLNK